MPAWAIAPFVLGMFWLSVFLGTIAEWRVGRDIFDGGDPPVVGSGAGGPPAWPPWLASAVAIGLCVVCVPTAVVLMGPPYLAARVCIWLWQRRAEPGAAPDRGGM
jgi:hypothetical protein